MKYLLDTHTLLWLADDSPNLPSIVREIFQDSKNQIFVSTASLWEMSIKISLEKLRIPMRLSEFVEREIRGNSIDILSINPAHCFELERMPYFHRDPFDRMIIAQAVYEKLVVITKDSAFRKYSAEVLW